MKVFISSVTYLLKEERQALPPFLRLFDHVPLRFEDFLSQDRSGREACLAGVEEAEVYVLLLGPRYGDPLPDSGLSPTAEEFRRARSRGIPILVFNKITDEQDEPEQLAFKADVGHYINGRLWKAFTDPLSLNQAVGEALKAVQAPAQTFRLRPSSRPDLIPTLSAAGLRGGQPMSPVLEAHLLPIGGASAVGARGLADLSSAFAREARSSSLVADADPLEAASNNDYAWAFRPPDAAGGWQERRIEQFRGLIAHSTGSVGAFLSLPTDIMGALVDRASLQRDLSKLLGLAAPHAADDQLTAVATLSNAERVWDGDPNQVGSRSSGSMRGREGLTIQVGGDFAIERNELTNHIGDIAAELAIRMHNDVRSLPH
jgi:hypothetical protein